MTSREEYRKAWENVPPSDGAEPSIPPGASAEAELTESVLPVDITEDEVNQILRDDQFNDER